MITEDKKIITGKKRELPRQRKVQADKNKNTTDQNKEKTELNRREKGKLAIELIEKYGEANIVKDFTENSLSIEGIARKVGVTARRIRNILKSRDVDLTNRNHSIKKIEYYGNDKIQKELNIDGMTTAEVADNIGVSPSTLCRYVKDKGLRPPRVNRSLEILREYGLDNLREQYIDHNRTGKDLAKELGIAESTLNKYLVSHNIFKFSRSYKISTKDDKEGVSKHYIRKL